MSIEVYRNFEIRGEQLVRVPPHLQGLWKPWWREMPDGNWIEGCMLEDDEASALDCARQCVDFKYRVEVWEFLEGRKYNPMADGNIPEFA